MTEMVIIAAKGEDNTIGIDGKIPWDIPEDLARFQRLTHGSPIIMGRKTYESIVERTGGPLNGRANIVLTHDPSRVEEASIDDTDLSSLGDVTPVHAAMQTAGAIAFAHYYDSDEIFVIGGATIYDQFLDVVDRLEITEVHESFDGDAHFPEIGYRWEEVERDERDGFAFVTYKRQ